MQTSQPTKGSVAERSPRSSADKQRQAWIDDLGDMLVNFSAVRDPNRPLRIGILGALGTGDVGDEAMLLALLDEIRALHPDVAVTVFSLNPELTEEYTGIPCKPAAQTWRTPRKNLWAALVLIVDRLETKLDRIVQRLRRRTQVDREQWLARLVFIQLQRRAKRLAARYRSGGRLGRGVLAQHVRDIIDLDVLFFLGGGYINSWHVKANSYLYLLSADVAVELDVPIIGTGMNLGPFNRFDLHRVARSLRHFRLIGLRDSAESFNVLKEMGIYAPERHRFSNDDALNLTPSAEGGLEKWAAGVGPFISLHVHYWRLTGKEWEDFATRLAQSIDLLLTRAELSFVMLPMLFGPQRARYDAQALTNIASRVSDPERMIMAPDELDPRQLKYLYGRAAGALVCRHHSMVFSLSAGVPTTGLSFDEYYRQKMVGVAESFGDLCTLLDAATCTPAQIADAVAAQLPDAME